MGKIIEVDKATCRTKLDEKLARLTAKKAPLDLGKYFGKIKFGEEGLAYQLRVRKKEGQNP